jgi:hypothetical protein
MEIRPGFQEENPMRLKGIVVMSITAASLSLGLSQVGAGAAPAAPASTAGASVAATVHDAVGTRGSVAPNIKFNPLCTGRTTSTVMLEYILPIRGVLNHWCFSNKGTWNFPSKAPFKYTSQFCAGNNFGTLKVVWLGHVHTYSLKPGTVLHFPIHTSFARLVSLTITGWSGRNTCIV